MTVAELAKALSLECLSVGGQDRVIAGGYCGDFLSWVMSRAKKDDVWITIMTNVNVASVAALTDVACVILAEGVMPDEQLLQKLDKIDASVLRSTLSAFELCSLVQSQLKPSPCC